MIRGLTAGCVGAMLVGSIQWANAAATLTLYDGVNPLIEVTDNGPGDINSASGGILTVTNVGVWAITVTTAITKPLFGSSTDPAMDVNLQATSTAAGSLRLVFSDNGFGPATGLLTGIVDGHIVSGGPATVEMDVWGDPANVVGATTVPIASTGTTPLPTSAMASGALALGAPFSLTEVLQLVAAGPTGLNSDASFTVAVPEPGVLGLSALGLVTWVLAGIRRRQA